ncbi:MAG TPA: hypothetical protein VH591_17525 [Ktedonobacterales bacterium]|jgi:hypothetical protein
MSSTSPAESAPDRSRRIAVRVLVVLVAITVVLAAFTAVYLFTRPSYAGTWVGPGNFQGAGEPVEFVVMLSLDQNPLGGIKGVGTLCAVQSGAPARAPITVSGSVSGSSANLTFSVGGRELSTFPLALATHASLSQEQLILSAGEPAFLLLTLQHGTASDFNAACNQLIQPAS